MTTISPYRPPHLFSSDAITNGQSHSASNTVRKQIPPAVPSPPPLETRTSPPRERPRERPTAIQKSPTYNMAVQEPSQWIFTEDEVLSSPSIMEGLEPVEERARRAKGVNFITQVGILLKLPQLTIAVASVFFHRFYMRQTMIPEKGGPHHYNIAATALFLATKTEENCRKTREIVVAVAKVAQKNTSLIIDEQSKEFWKWKDNMLVLEETMLELLTFDLVMKTPHNCLFEFLQRLGIENTKPLRNVAWSFLNDSIMTPLCLMMPAADIAVAAIYFATKFSGESIPDDENGVPWWEVINGDPEKIAKATSVLDQFWTENPLKRAENPYGASPSSTEDLDQTRKKAGSDGGSVAPLSDGGSQHTQNPQDAFQTAEPNSQAADSLPNGIVGGLEKCRLPDGSLIQNGKVSKEDKSDQERIQNEEEPEEEGEVDQIAAPDSSPSSKPTNGSISHRQNGHSPQKRKSLDRDSEPAAKRARTADLEA